MTASAPSASLRALTRASHLAPSGNDGSERTFITLLSLNFMLLAFFVVLGTASSFDQPRAANVAKSMRVHFAAPEAVANGASEIRLTARQALQAGVSEAFAGLLPATTRTRGENGDRADISVSADVIAAAGAHGMDDLLDGIAHLMRAAPTGVHYELVLAGGPDVTTMAAALIARGVAPAQLMTGTDAAEDSAMRFSFLLLEGDEETPFAQLIAREVQ